MSDVGNRSIFGSVNVESVLDKVLGDHLSWGDDARLLGEISLAEVL